MTGLKIAEIFHEAKLPAGVLNVVPGSKQDVGEVLLSDPRVRMVTFTGSTNVGKKIAVEAAKHLKKFTLEMGGENLLIVLRDADIDYAVRAACFGIFFHLGQVCMANSRLIVEEAIYDEFCAKNGGARKTYQVGDPHDPHTVIGPRILPQPWRDLSMCCCRTFSPRARGCSPAARIRTTSTSRPSCGGCHLG